MVETVFSTFSSKDLKLGEFLWTKCIKYFYKLIFIDFFFTDTPGIHLFLMNYIREEGSYSKINVLHINFK